DIGAEAWIIEKSGDWYAYNVQKIGQGREKEKLYLKDNPAVLAEVEAKVKEFLGIRAAAPVPEEAPADD
ncbi:MAG: DNA recombination/repair protein RecA, partial [Gemmatimonadota bacterium]